MSDDLKKELQATTLPQIGGYNGDYTDEDYVRDVFRRALARIKALEEALREVVAKLDHYQTATRAGLPEYDPNDLDDFVKLAREAAIRALKETE